MTDEGEEVVVERLPPSEAFELLAHEIRVRTIEALDDADEPPSFGELRHRVGVDDPGQFNYHLGKLVGRFVRETDDGYWLTAAGRRVVGAVLSGAYTRSLEGDPVPVDGACDVCDGPLEAQFRGERLAVTCRDCGFDRTAPAVPPAVVEGWPRERVAEAVDRWTKRKHAAAMFGLCPSCDGRVDRTVCLPGDDEAPHWFAGQLSVADVVARCRRCDHWWHALIEYAAVLHPALVAFHHEHGVDVRTTPRWELDWLTTGVATVAAEDPLRVELPVTLDDDRRVFVFDDELDLVAERDG